MVDETRCDRCGRLLSEENAAAALAYYGREPYDWYCEACEIDLAEAQAPNV